MSDVTNNEDEVATVVEETEAVVSTPDVVAEAPVDDAVAEAPVAEVEAPAEAPVEVAVEDAPVATTVAEAPAPAPAPPKAKVPATFVIKTLTKAAAPDVVAVEDDGVRDNSRKVREGIVLSDKMNQTLVVVLTERVSHPKYGKTVQRSKKLYVHDANNDAKIGDRVRVTETRPLSKLKRWRLTEIVERAR